MNWDNIKVFLAIVRAGSVTGAGFHLSIDESTVARRLKSLEESLGAKLFHTSGGARKLSPFGAHILRSAQDMEVAEFNIEAASKNVGEGPSGTVRVSASTMIARHILMPRIGNFRRDYPDMVLELCASNETADLDRLEADVAVRMARPKEGDYIIRKIAVVEYGVYEHRDHRGGGQWIGFTGALARMPDVAAVQNSFDVPPGITTNEPGLMLEAVLTGEVAALLPRFVGDKTNELVRVEDIPARHRESWLVFRSDMKTALNIRAATRWIDHCFRSLPSEYKDLS